MTVPGLPGSGFIGSTARFDNFHNPQGRGSFRYPSPFFDIGHTYLPTSVKQMFRWCRYYFLTNPIINAVTYKMAEYPITQLVVDEADQELRQKWDDIYENILKLRPFNIEVGLDYHCYGNAFVTVHFPFEKYLICSNCSYNQKAEHSSYKFRNFRYYLACPKCDTTTEAKVNDHNIKDLHGIKLIRWNPEHITVEHNEVTGRSDFFFEVPTSLRNDIMMGKRHVVETVPNEFIEALKHSKSLRFRQGEMFHLKRPTIAQKDQGWGTPLILPVLKDTYYLQILRKAQEAIAQQYIVPLRVIFPSAGSSSADPYSTSDLSLWRRRIESEIEKWKLDNNYIPVLPLPIGSQTIGGEGKALMLHQEMRAWSEQIVAGMQVPIEFVFGGLQYSGSNVSMRILENQFIGYRQNLLLLNRDFIANRVARYMGWSPPKKMHFRRFRMADDLQRSALIFQMNQAMKVSDTTLLSEVDLENVQEEKFKAAELTKQIENQRKMQLASAALQGDLQIIQARYQTQAMRIMAGAGMMPGAPPDPHAMGSGASGATEGNAHSMPTPELPGGGPPAYGGDQQPDVGSEAAPGMPDNATAYPENGQSPHDYNTPTEVQSPLNMQQAGGQYNILYLARRAAAAIKEYEGVDQQMALMQLRAQNPQLYMLVLRFLIQGEGSQESSMNPMQQPMPEAKPPRRQAQLV
jgi:hypothetical protein